MSESATNTPPAATPLGDDDGFVSFDLGGDKFRVDLYQVHNRLIRINDEAENTPEGQDPVEAENQAIADYMAEIGFPPVSHKMALKFAVAVHDAVKGCKKKDESAPSPSTNADSTASTASPSAA